MKKYQFQKDCKLGYFENLKKYEKIEVITGEEYIERYSDVPQGGTALIVYDIKGKMIGGITEKELERMVTDEAIKLLNS